MTVAKTENWFTEYISEKAFVSYLEKNGRKESTIKGYVKTLKSLNNSLVNLENPESVKEYLVSKDVTDGRKRNIV